MGSAKYIHGSATKETLKKEKNRKNCQQRTKIKFQELNSRLSIYIYIIYIYIFDIYICIYIVYIYIYTYIYIYKSKNID